MAMKLSDVRNAIETALPGAKIELSEMVEDGEHYMVYVESEMFRGKTRVQQHRMVYDALGGKMGIELHALMVQTVVPQS